MSSDPSGSRRLLVALAAACVAAGSITALAARERIVAMAPMVAPAYAALGLQVNPRGLAIEGVTARFGETGERKFLMVEGWIVNLRDDTTRSPDLKIALRGSDGEPLYVWTAHPSRTRLDRAERLKFTARLEAPPDGAKDAIVSFVDAAGKAAPGTEGS